MKVYNRIVIDIATGEVIDSESFDYAGEVAELKGPKTPKPMEPASGRIVGSLYTPDGKTPGPLQGALKGILSSPGDDPFTQRQADLLTQKVRQGYGARGLATSGIAAQGEQDTLKDFLLQRGEQKQGQAIQILGTGGTAPMNPTAQQPRGLFGLK